MTGGDGRGAAWGCPGPAKQASVGLPKDVNAVSAFANCGRAVAQVRGSYVSIADIARLLDPHATHCEASPGSRE